MSVFSKAIESISKNIAKALHKEKRGIYNVTYNGKFSTPIKKDLATFLHPRFTLKSRTKNAKTRQKPHSHTKGRTMFHIYFLMFAHSLFDLRNYWVGALISGITSLVSTGISAGMQVKQMKEQSKAMDKQMELTQKQMEQTQNSLNKQEADKKALGESLNQSADSIKSASDNSAGMSAVGGNIGGIDGNLNSLGGLSDTKTGIGISTKSAMDKE